MKKFGIRVTLPPGDSMRAPHLLGENWESFRWYDSERERDLAFEDMLRQPGYYRYGDTPTQQLEKVQR